MIYLYRHSEGQVTSCFEPINLANSQVEFEEPVDLYESPCPGLRHMHSPLCRLNDYERPNTSNFPPCKQNWALRIKLNQSYRTVVETCRASLQCVGNATVRHATLHVQKSHAISWRSHLEPCHGAVISSLHGCILESVVEVMSTNRKRSF